MTWIVDKVLGRLIDKASVEMSARQVWMTIAVLALLIAFLSAPDEVEPEADSVPEREPQAETVN